MTYQTGYIAVAAAEKNTHAAVAIGVQMGAAKLCYPAFVNLYKALSAKASQNNPFFIAPTTLPFTIKIHPIYKNKEGLN